MRLRRIGYGKPKPNIPKDVSQVIKGKIPIQKCFIFTIANSDS